MEPGQAVIAMGHLHAQQAIVFDITDDAAGNLKTIEIPVPVPLMRILSVHSSLTEAVTSLSQLQAFEGDPHTAPYLEVRVLLEGPELDLRHKIETAISGKNFRLAKIDVRYKSTATNPDKVAPVDPEQFNRLRPIEVLHKVYQARYDSPIPSALQKLFQQVEQEVNELEGSL